MKSFCLLFILTCVTLLKAQAPNQFRYQAVARDANGEIITGNIEIRFSLLEDDSTGIARYKKTHTTATNAQGIFALAVGKGTKISGDMESIDWTNHPYWLQVELKTPGSSTFISLGSTQLLSVPYALYASHSGDQLLEGTGINIDNGIISNTGDLSDQNELQTLSVNGNQLSISDGNTVTMPTGTTYNQGSGIQINGNTISAVDANMTNEIQTLSLNGQQLSLSNGGGSVQLPSGSSDWATGGNTTYNNPTTNNVGIGTTTSTTSKLNVVSSGNQWAGNFSAPSGDAVHTYSNGTGAGIVSGSLNGTAGIFTSVNGTAGYFSSGDGKGLIVENGSVGIGITTPVYKLDVHHGTTRLWGAENGTSATVIGYSYNGNPVFSTIAYDGGDVAHFLSYGGYGLILTDYENGGMGTGLKFENLGNINWNQYADAAKDMNFAFNGTLRAWISDTDGSYHNSSDSRLKKDILPMSNVLGGISKLQAYTYHMKDAPEGAPVSVGFMAQEVEKQFPQLVEEKNGYKSLCYDHFAVLAIQAVKEQQQQIDRQQTRLDAQQVQLDAQATAIQQLQQEMNELKKQLK